MGISFEKALGIHEQALQFRVKRAEVLANNLVNADTPGFKARDLDFNAMLSGEINQGLSVARTNERHIDAGAEAGFSSALLYRNPIQPAIDGNTVDTNVELAEYAKNAMDYEASFQFLNAKFRGLSSAIKGE